MAPADAGDVGTAPFWYYVDNSGAQQGPFAVAHMHSWHAAGYLLPTTKMAASYYGEVPDEFWPLAELFEASEQPFANGTAAPAPAESASATAPAPAQPAAAAAGSGGPARKAAAAAAGPMPAHQQHKQPRPAPYERPDGAAARGRGGSKGRGGGGGKGKGGRSDPDRALPPHLARIQAMGTSFIGGGRGFNELHKHNATGPK